MARDEDGGIEPFCEEEVAEAIESLKSGRALGVDRVYPEAVKALLTVEPELLRRI